MLSHHVARLGNRPADMQALVRVKATRPPFGLTRAQRAENLRGAFRVRDSARLRLQSQRILLIDDVSTTGATGNAAARVLLRAGAARVDLLTFATVAAEAG